jgi:hypothetical protein
MVMVFDVAVIGLTHEAVDVNTQVTVVPLARADVVKLLLSVPAFILSTFHW